MISLLDLLRLKLRGYSFTTAGNIWEEADMGLSYLRVRYIMSDTAFFISAPEQWEVYIPANVLTPLPDGIPYLKRCTVHFRTAGAAVTVRTDLYYVYDKEN